MLLTESLVIYKYGLAATGNTSITDAVRVRSAEIIRDNLRLFLAICATFHDLLQIADAAVQEDESPIAGSRHCQQP